MSHSPCTVPAVRPDRRARRSIGRSRSASAAATEGRSADDPDDRDREARGAGRSRSDARAHRTAGTAPQAPGCPHWHAWCAPSERCRAPTFSDISARHHNHSGLWWLIALEGGAGLRSPPASSGQRATQWVGSRVLGVRHGVARGGPVSRVRSTSAGPSARRFLGVRPMVVTVHSAAGRP